MKITPDVGDALSSLSALMSLNEVTADNSRNLFKLPRDKIVEKPFAALRYRVQRQKQVWFIQ